MLFDRATDPWELENVADQNPKVLESLTKQLDRFREQSVPVEQSRTSIEINADLLEELEALGYTGDE